MDISNLKLVKHSWKFEDLYHKNIIFNQLSSLLLILIDLSFFMLMYTVVVIHVEYLTDVKYINFKTVYYFFNSLLGLSNFELLFKQN